MSRVDPKHVDAKTWLIVFRWIVTEHQRRSILSAIMPAELTVAIVCWTLAQMALLCWSWPKVRFPKPPLRNWPSGEIICIVRLTWAVEWQGVASLLSD